MVGCFNCNISPGDQCLIAGPKMTSKTDFVFIFAFFLANLQRLYGKMGEMVEVLRMLSV